MCGREISNDTIVSIYLLVRLVACIPSVLYVCVARSTDFTATSDILCDYELNRGVIVPFLLEFIAYEFITVLLHAYEFIEYITARFYELYGYLW